MRPVHDHRHPNLLTARPIVRRLHPAADVALRVSYAIGVTLVIVALFVAPFAWSGLRAYGAVADGREALLRAEKHAGAMEFAEARDAMTDANDDFTIARDAVRRFSPFAEVPGMGTYVSAAEQLLDSGVAATLAARAVYDVAASVTDTVRASQGIAGELPFVLPDPKTLLKDLNRQQRRDMLAALASRNDEIGDALANVERAIVSLDRIPKADLPASFSAPISIFRERLTSAQAALSAARPLAQMAPSVLGYPTQKRYLVFFQNNTELRPTGGFLGVYGVATVADAELLSFTTDDVYAIDGPSEKSPRPSAPAPVTKYIGVQKWYLRDANWSPDFPTAVQVMEKFYREETQFATKADPGAVDGVVAFTPQLAIDLLRLVGPVTVDGKTFTPDNVVDALEFEVEKGFVTEGIAFHARKDIVGDLSHAVAGKLMALPVGSLLEVIGIARKNLSEGHVLLSFKDPVLHASVERNDWAGRVREVKTDYVSVIDANMAALKSDPSVLRTVSYAIAPDKDGLVGTVRMTYDHRGRFDWKTTRYRTYVRAFVPAGSTLIGVDGAMENDKLKDPKRRPGTPDQGDELGRKWFGAFISIEPGERKEIAFRFRLAPKVVQAVKDGSYALTVEKQAGTVAHGLTLDLAFGKKLTDAAPAEERKDWGDERYRLSTDLRTDRTIEVAF